MRSEEEAKKLLRDAEACFVGAQKSLTMEDFRTAVQNAQLAVELPCKAVIACFAEPEWPHDPSAQFLDVLRIHSQGVKAIGEGSNIVSRYLGYFLEKGIMERVGRSRYHFVDPVYKEWLQYKYGEVPT